MKNGRKTVQRGVSLNRVAPTYPYRQRFSEFQLRCMKAYLMVRKVTSDHEVCLDMDIGRFTSQENMVRTQCRAQDFARWALGPFETV